MLYEVITVYYVIENQGEVLGGGGIKPLSDFDRP